MPGLPGVAAPPGAPPAWPRSQTGTPEASWGHPNWQGQVAGTATPTARSWLTPILELFDGSGPIGWLLVAAVCVLASGLAVSQSTTAFFTDTRIVSGNTFTTAAVALNETPFTAFNFEKFVPGDVFVRPLQVTNSTASNSGAINVQYFMTVKDGFSNCSTQDPACSDAKGSLSDPVTGLRLVAIRCFSDTSGLENVACESSSLKSVRLVKGVMETIWPGGAANATTDIAGFVRDRNETAQYGNVGGTGSERNDVFPAIPNSGRANDYYGRPIIFAKAGALSTQPISVKITPGRNETAPPAQLGSVTLTNTSKPIVQGSDVLRIGGTRQDLDGNWMRAVRPDGGAASTQACGDVRISVYGTMVPDLAGCGAEVVGVPLQTLSNPNCNGLASAAPNRAVVLATGNSGSQAGPGANATVVSVNVAAQSPTVFSSQSHGACLMGGSDFEKNTPLVLSPRINNQLMAVGGGDTPRIVSDIPAQSLLDQSNMIAGLGAGKSDNLALIVYLPSWSTQSTQAEASSTALQVQSRQTVDAQNNPTSVPIGGVGNKVGGRASYTVAFTAVQPVGQTFALANVAQQSANVLESLAGQIGSTATAFQVQASDSAEIANASTLVAGAIQTVSPNVVLPGSIKTLTVTGRGFAKVTAIPQNVKAEASVGGSGTLTGSHRYVVVASTSESIELPANPPSFMKAANQSWTQGEPSAEVEVSLASAGTATISWTHVPGATHYQIYRDVVRGAAGVVSGGTRLTIEYGAAQSRSVPDSAGWVSGSTVSIIDPGSTGVADAATTFPAVGRPCAAYSAAGTFGMCPGVEVLPAGPITATSPGTCARLNSRRFILQSDSSECGRGYEPAAFRITSGEVLAATGGVARRGEAGQSEAYVWGSPTGLLQADAALRTDPAVSVSMHSSTDNEDTAGFVSANQLTFGLTSYPIVPGTITRYGIRITNPNHVSLPLDFRGKVMVAPDAIAVQPASITEVTPSTIGRISEGNTLTIKGSGFQQGAIVHLGYYLADVNSTPGCGGNGGDVEPSPFGAGRVVARGLMPSQAQGDCFVSKSHIKNRAKNTLDRLGTDYLYGGMVLYGQERSGYNEELSAPQGDLLVGATGLWAKAAEAVPNTCTSFCVPWFSYDHDNVVVNSPNQITMRGVTVTNVIAAPVGVAVKVYNPDRSVVYGQTFGIGAPGIEQIVQVDSAGNTWLSAAQGRTVTLQFRASAADTFVKSANGRPPTVSISCFASAYDASAPWPRGGGTGWWADLPDPCFSQSTGATQVGVAQIGDLAIVDGGRTVQGQFSIAPAATVALRKFTMTNGDGAVFSNYFVVSRAPTVDRLSYPGGTSRVVPDNQAALAGGGTSLAADPTARFDVQGAIPRGARRRVLLTGAGFVRGSFGPFNDPTPPAAPGDMAEINALCAGTKISPSSTPPGRCFGWRSVSSLVNAQTGPDSVPVITFSAPGVQVAAGTTTVVQDDASDLSMASSYGQGLGGAGAFIATKRLTTVIEVSPTATAGPVTMTITNPDGGQVVVPNAFVVNGVPTIGVVRDAFVAVGNGAPVTASDATIVQGQAKTGANAILIYGSGFFHGGTTRLLDPSNTIVTPRVQIGGTGVRVTKVSMGHLGAGTVTDASDDNEMLDSVLRVELEAEATASIGVRSLTVVLSDGQAVSLPNAIEVVRPGGTRSAP
jgi:hypothetical protein